MRKFTLIVAMLIAGVTVSACRDGHPGYDSDHHHHHRGHDGPGYR